MTSSASFFRSLASLHRAGIPWPQAVDSAAAGSARYGGVQRALQRGASLGEALDPVVDPLDAALVRAGEQDGSLESVFQDIAEMHESAARRRRERWVGLTYPLLLAHLAAILLPLPDLIQGRPGAALLWAAVVLLPVYAFLLWQRAQDRRERPRPDRKGSPPPVSTMGPWRNRVEEADARALDALGRLYDAGVPIREGIDLAMRAGWGGRAALDLEAAGRRLDRGEDLAGAWSHLPGEYANRLRTGEESGNLGEAARRAADELRFGVDMRRKRTAATLPTVVLLVLGGLIAWRVISFYAGMYGNLPF
ncbi:MAG: type II secretion system F family protein [Planctomycetota bacterium]|jgi:type II secretory pathway component PulF